jgi:cellulose biosynthesis protein BcsQ
VIFVCSEAQARIIRSRLRNAEVAVAADDLSSGKGPVVILRGAGVRPEAVTEAAVATGGGVPVVVATGPPDEVGLAFEAAAREAGLPEKCILRGEATLSQLVRLLDGLDAENDLPDPPLFLGEPKFDPVLVGAAAGPESGAPPPEAAPRCGFGPVLRPGAPAEWRRPGGKLVAVVGACGGVGRTVVAASLAAVLRRQGASVAAIDAGHPMCLGRYLGADGGCAETGPEEAAVAEAVAEARGDVVLVDTAPSPPYLERLLGVADAAVVVVTPDPFVYEKTAEFWPLAADRAVLAVNRVSEGGRNLRKSFVDMVIREEMKDCLGLVEIPETEEVVQAFTQGVSPARYEVFGTAAGRVLACLGI